MATTVPPSLHVGPDTLITVKIHHNDNTRRFKIPLRDLGARVLPQKVCLHPSSIRAYPSTTLRHPHYAPKNFVLFYFIFYILTSIPFFGP